jgi:hypothetical protein
MAAHGKEKGADVRIPFFNVWNGTVEYLTPVLKSEVGWKCNLHRSSTVWHD